MTRTLLVALDHQAADFWCREHEVPRSEAVVVVTSSPMPYVIHGLGTVFVAWAPGWYEGPHASQIFDVVATHQATWGEPPYETAAIDPVDVETRG